MGLEVQVGTVPWGPGIWVLEGSGPMVLPEWAALDSLLNSSISWPSISRPGSTATTHVSWLDISWGWPGRTPSLPVLLASLGIWRQGSPPHPCRK